MPSRRTSTSHAPYPRVWRGRLQLPAPRLVRDHVFPLQVAILLSRPGEDFTGGEFVMTESSPSHQRADVVALRQGDAIAFTVNQRPVPGKRSGTRKVAMRHGVSRIRSGKRHTVGLIFHDAR